MDQFYDIISHIFSNYSPLMRNFIIFLLAYVEGLPVITIVFPGSLIAVMIGSFTHTGLISPLQAINFIALGSFLGDITSLYFGPKFLKFRWFKNFVEKESYQKHWNLFDKHIGWIIIFSKLIPLVRSTPSLFAAARNISKVRYIFYTLIGSYLWSIAGIYGGNFLARIFGKSSIFIILILFIVFGFGLYILKIKSKK